MSTTGTVLLALALVIVSASCALTGTVAWRIFRSRPSSASADSDADVAQEPDGADEAQDVALRNFMLAPEYLDTDAFSALAAELDLDVDPVRIETSTSHQYSAQVGASIDARLTLPGVGELGSSLAAEETSADISQQSIATTRRQGLTSLMTDAGRRLAERGQLRTELTAAPQVDPDVVSLAWSLVRIYDAWRLRDLPATPKPQIGVSDQLLRALVPPASEPPLPTQDQLLRDAVDRVWSRTMEAVITAKQHELKELADEGGLAFAAEVTTWRVWAAEDGSELRLYNNALQSDMGVLATRGLLEVPLTPARLTDSGRHRLTPGAVLFLVVFARIGRYSAESGTLLLHPIAIFSG